MIAITRRKLGASISDIFFASHPDAFETRAAICFFVQSQEPYPGLSPFRTRIVDLTQPEDQLFATLSSNTRYKINRAEREGLQSEVYRTPSADQILAFAGFYDEFARQKELHQCNRQKMFALNDLDALILSSVSDPDGRVLCAHAYVSDSTLRRARLLYSASHFRALADSAERNVIGRANRLLHWHDMASFKQMGFVQYDLGGVAENDADPAKSAIAKFKLEFGGEQVTEYNGFVPKTMFGKVLLAVKRGLR